MIINLLSENVELYKIPDDVIESQLNDDILKSMCVTASGYFPEALGHNLKRSADVFTAVLYCTAGVGYFEYEGKTWPVKAGDCLFCLPNIPHRYWADKKNPWTIYWSHVEGNDCQRYFDLLDINIENPLIKIDIVPSIMALFRDICNTAKKGYNLHNAYFLSSCARQIFTTMIKLKSENFETGHSGRKFSDVLNLMNEKIRESITIPELAEYCCLSQSYFVRKFKQKFGYSPIEYFNRLKIQTASHYLSASELSIKQVAHHLGFEDPLYFSRLFHKIMKVSPREYKKKNKVI